jgi:hypothetical protein
MPVLTGLTIVSDALADLNIVGAGDPVSNDDAVFVLARLNRIIDSWNADRAAIFAAQFQTFVLTPSLSPHTIGPTGTWVTPQRPQSIEDAALFLAGATGAQVPITVHDDPQWYADLSYPSITTSMPTDVYYEPDFPNGKLFFYPVPSAAKSVEILTRQVLSAFLLTTVFVMPPGYQEALTLTLEEALIIPYEVPRPPTLSSDASKARARIFAANRITPKIQTRDAGMPGGHPVSGGTYLNGWQGT